jgi:nicotinamidase-related amidase
MKKALILVDIQNDYFKGGRYELVNPDMMQTLWRH